MEASRPEKENDSQGGGCPGGARYKESLHLRPVSGELLIHHRRSGTKANALQHESPLLSITAAAKNIRSYWKVKPVLLKRRNENRNTPWLTGRTPTPGTRLQRPEALCKCLFIPFTEYERWFSDLSFQHLTDFAYKTDSSKKNISNSQQRCKEFLWVTVGGRPHTTPPCPPPLPPHLSDTSAPLPAAPTTPYSSFPSVFLFFTLPAPFRQSSGPVPVSCSQCSRNNTGKNLWLNHIESCLRN